MGPYPGGASQGHAHITAPRGLLPAEALAAGKDMLQGEGKIQRDLDGVVVINWLYHRAVVPLFGLYGRANLNRIVAYPALLGNRTLH